jgi:hypothetical protein
LAAHSIPWHDLPMCVGECVSERGQYSVETVETYHSPSRYIPLHTGTLYTMSHILHRCTCKCEWVLDWRSAAR